MAINRLKTSCLILLILLSYFTPICAEDTTTTPMIFYQTHLENIGWTDEVTNGSTSGTTGENRQIEAIKIRAHFKNSTIEYQSHISEIGWEDTWKKSEEISGTTGQDKRLEAIKIRINGPDANVYDIYYRTHVSNVGWLDWAKNGEESGSSGFSRKMEAIEITLVPKGTPAPGSTLRPFVYKGMEPIEVATSHVENVGWTKDQSFETMIGTTGKNQQLEAIKLKFLDDSNGGIIYKTHLADIGWEEDWASNGELSGTEGQARRIEAVRIALTGSAEENYDIYYQAHVSNLGWLGWAKNGEAAGSSQAALKMEALNIKVVPKGEDPPGQTELCFVTPLDTRSFLDRIHGCWLATELAQDPTKSYSASFSDSYMTAGLNQTFEGFEGTYNVDLASTTGGKITVTDAYNNKTNEIYIDFRDIPGDHLKINVNGQVRELFRGSTTDGIHYTFSGVKQYGQLMVMELKDGPK